MGKIYLYSCEFHIECVMEDFINDLSSFPNLTINENEDCICRYCDIKAKYIISDT